MRLVAALFHLREGSVNNGCEGEIKCLQALVTTCIRRLMAILHTLLEIRQERDITKAVLECENHSGSQRR